MSSYHLSLTEADVTYARDELHEHDVPDALTRLKSWIQAQGQLKCCTSDDFLTLFLRKARFDQSLARQLLEEHVRLRVTSSVTLTSPVVDEGTMEHFERAHAFLLPGRAHDGSRVMVYRPYFPDAEKLGFHHGMRTHNVIIDMMTSDPVLQVRGITFIGDFRLANLTTMGAMTFSMMKMYTSLFGTHCQLDVRANHLVYAPLIMTGIARFLKGVLRSNIFSLFTIHGNGHKNLLQVAPPETLPVELGGTAGTYEELGAKWTNYLKENSSSLDWVQGFEYHDLNENKKA